MIGDLVDSYSSDKTQKGKYDLSKSVFSLKIYLLTYRPLFHNVKHLPECYRCSKHFCQIFITDTNRDHLDQILSQGHFDYKLFHVNDGEIEF